MPSAPIVTWARIFPLLAAVTPRSRYLKKERRPATRGAVSGVAWASLPGGVTTLACSTTAFASFIIDVSLGLIPPILLDLPDFLEDVGQAHGVGVEPRLELIGV